MKNFLLLTVAACTLSISAPPAAHAASRTTKGSRAAHIASMCQDREVRVMMLKELTNTPERKREVARMLKADEEFGKIYEREFQVGG